MASTYSTNLALELIGTGDQSGTWGTTTNTNLGTLIEQAISGYVTQAITDGADTVITIPNGATGIARNMFLELTGALTNNRNLIVPANKKLYFIYNNTTGGYAVTVKVSGLTGVSVPNGAKMLLVSNGTDVVVATNNMVSLNISGNLGVGTTTPLFKLDVSGTGTDTFFRQINTGTAASDDSIISIQTSSTGATATLSGIYFGDGDSQTVGRIWYSHASDNMQFFTLDTLQAVLDSSGYLLLGYGGSNGAYRLQVNSQIFATNATIATSDGRYKQDIATLPSGLSLIEALRPVTFTWKKHPIHNFPVGQTDIGFIAQEVNTVLADTPYLSSVVKMNSIEGESFLGMADTKFIPLLVRAIQELSARIATLENN